MSATLEELSSKRTPAWIGSLPFYYGWVNVVIAAVAMTATLPGRTHGLGLITKPLLDDPALGLNEQLISRLNFWAILIGSALCLPAGRLIDRIGARAVLVTVAIGLGFSVVGMSMATTVPMLFLAVVLIRGLGQGALSVVSMALVGKWFTRRIGPAMGVYTVLLGVGFVGSTVGLGESVKALGWRPAWSGLGLVLLLGLAPLGFLLARSSPETLGLDVEGKSEEAIKTRVNLALGQTLRSPSFWVFTLAMSLFNLVWSAITLFSETLLEDHHLKASFIPVMAVLVFSGLPTNLIAGWLSTRWPMGRLLGVGMVVLALSLASFPWVSTHAQALTYSAALGIAGGIVTVVFFAIYGHAFGRGNLGAIQAVAQTITVFASAAGPVFLTEIKLQAGSSMPFFLGAAVISVCFAVACWFVKLPSASV